MIQRWQDENFCGHCPANKGFESNVSRIRKFRYYGICVFCRVNVTVIRGCPCDTLGPTALTKAKDFVQRFEAEDGGDE
jgi:hypothetical protein